MKSLGEYLYNTRINEMASSMSDFRKLVDSLEIRIIENWCLVRLCDLYPDKPFTVNRNHWCSELRLYILRSRNKTLKTGKKINIVKDVFVKEDELDDNVRIAELIRDKFNKENLQKYINIISIECSKNINDICGILAEPAMMAIDTYLESPIG